jgi:hypothetical protein
VFRLPFTLKSVEIPEELFKFLFVNDMYILLYL